MEVDWQEAAKRLDELLDALSKGASIVITRDGVPVGRLVHIAPPKSKEEIKKAIEALKELSKGVTLGGLKLKDLIEEGRR